MNGKKIHITLPIKFVESFDEAIKDSYATRTEAIRAGMRLLLEDLQARQQGEIVGVE